MNSKIKYSVLIMLALTLFIGLANAQPTNLGTTLQPNPFDSNPTAYTISGFTTTQVPAATGPNMFDGTFGTGESVQLFTSLASTPASAYINLTGFKIPASPTFSPGWMEINVNIGISTVTGTTANTLAIQYTIPGQGWVILKPATRLNVAIVTQSLSFSQLPRPGGGSWSWSDIASITVQFLFTKGTTTWSGRFFNIFEVWTTVFNSPTPPTNGGTVTFSMQPSIVYGVDANSAVPAVFVEIYVNGVHDLFSYEFNITVDPTILTPIEADLYGPWTLSLGGSPTIDPSATPSWIYVASSMPPPVLVGQAFNGSSPVARIYFLCDAIAPSASAIHFKPGTVILGDSTGTQIPSTNYDGVYQFNVPPLPEFPLGLGLVMLLAPAIPLVYIWRSRKHVKRS